MEPTARSKKLRENSGSARSAANNKSAKPGSSAKSYSNTKNGSGIAISKISNTNNSKQNHKNHRNSINTIRQNINKSNTINSAGGYAKRHYNNGSVSFSSSMSSINTAGVGVMDIPGRARIRSADLDRYRERAQKRQTFPNRRRKIITGKDLTTPLRRVKVKEKKVYLKVITVNRQKKKFPVGIIACVFAATTALLCLICSYIVLNDYSTSINNQRIEILSEEKRGRDLQSALDNKNDLNAFINIATNDFDMVKEDSLVTHYISVKSKDKAEVVEEQNSIVFRIPSIFSAIFSAK